MIITIIPLMKRSFPGPTTAAVCVRQWLTVQMTVMVELVLPTVPTAETPVGGGGTEGGTGRKSW